MNTDRIHQGPTALLLLVDSHPTGRDSRYSLRMEGYRVEPGGVGPSRSRWEVSCADPSVRTRWGSSATPGYVSTAPKTEQWGAFGFEGWSVSAAVEGYASSPAC